VDKLPFSVYDFFGYLSAGFVLLVGLAAAFTGSEAWQRTPGAGVALLLVVVAYTAGQVIANISGYLIEGSLVRRILGAPNKVLFAESRPRWAWLLPGYYRALPLAQRERVLTRAEQSGVTEPGEGLFYHCFAAAKSSPATLARLESFLNLYGFCRNMAISTLIVAVALLAGTLLGTAKTGALVAPGWWAAAALAASVGLLYRYLKFFRHYSVEVFVSYAESPDTKAVDGNAQ
jgi:hypothetical protein